MDRRLRLAVGGGAVAVLTLLASGATAGEEESPSHNTLQEQLTGYEETPLALSTTGSGAVRLRIGPAAGTISYALSYSGLEAPVAQAHIHFGARAQSGGISAFLCSNLGNGPVGTQTCPDAPGMVSGTLGPADVIGPAGQGIGPGEFDELVAAIRAGATYVNVHSDKYQAGEIRAQLEDG